ncbi:MAG: hypothetical protein OXG49_01905 [Chloroflexi bacterium]|nr:hypothetical protein [Chloroflexota bacterium]
MKRAKRDRVLNQLCADLDSGDFDVREYAMFQLALLLRRANVDAPTLDISYEDDHLSRDQLRLRLTHGDQAQIAAHLLRVVSRYAESRASAFWALAEVSSDVAIAPVLSVIGEEGDQFNDEAAYHACRALWRWLELDTLGKGLFKALPEDDRLLSFLKRWSRSSDVRLAESANAVMSLARGRSN